jgi:hypothetical protein
MISWSLFALFVTLASLTLWFAELEADQSEEGELR